MQWYSQCEKVMMIVVLKLVAIVALVQVAYSQTCAITWYIDSAYSSQCDICHSSDQELCCRTLMDALQQWSPSCHNYYYMPPGDQFINSTPPVFAKSPGVYFMGQASNIVCKGSSIGWSFADIHHINIDNVTFSGCSTLQPSTSRNGTTNSTFLFQVALYFANCEEVYLTHVSVEALEGVTSVAAYNPGHISAESCTFTNGQGGFVLELTNYQPGFVDPTHRYYTRSSSSFSFQNCTFGNNSAPTVAMAPTDRRGFNMPSGLKYNSFGKGGGLSIIVKGDAYSNTFTITNCRFLCNQAQHGGGLFVSFLDNTYGNSISVQGSSFLGNRCPLERVTPPNIMFSGGPTSTGGGIHIENAASQIESNNNHIGQWDSNTFEENIAFTGGAVYVNSYNMLNDMSGIYNTTFTSNVALFGSGLYTHRPSLLGGWRSLVVRGCTLKNNRLPYSMPSNSITSSGMGSLYAQNTDLLFEQSVVFAMNQGSALVLVSALANFSAGCSASFTKNIGTRGGAMTLLGNSIMLVGKGALMKFEQNTAKYEGGAIFNQYPMTSGGLDHHLGCFIRHENDTLDPDYWEVMFVFNKNVVLLNGIRGNAIHSTTILPCLAAGKAGGLPFYWRNWTYNDEEAVDHVTSDPSPERSDLNLTEHSMSVSPGWPMELPLALLDDFNHTTRNRSYITTTSDGSVSVSINNLVHLHWPVNEEVEVEFESVGDRSLYFKLNVTMQMCPPGFVYSKSKSECVCPDYSKLNILLECKESPRVAIIVGNYWMGLIGNSSKHYYLAQCPIHFCNTSHMTFHILPNNFHNLSGKLCNENREGVLCGECKEDSCLSVTSWTYKCVKDHKKKTSSRIAKYVAAIYLPLFIMLLLLLFLSFFRVRLTAGSLGGFVLYSQMLMSCFDLTEHDHIKIKQHFSQFPNTYRFLYGPFNLDFLEKYLEDVCLSNKLHVLSACMLDYLLFIVPTLSVVLVCVCIKLYKHCNRGRVVHFDTETESYFTRRFQSVAAYFHPVPTSLGDVVCCSLSTLVLLSYTKLSFASARILLLQKLIPIEPGESKQHRVYMAGDFTPDDSNYLLYKIPAIICEIYLVFLILLLLDYPLRAVNLLKRNVRYLRRVYPSTAIITFVEAFQNGLKPQFRCFSGLYFIFRYIICLVHASRFSLTITYIIQELLCVIMLFLLFISQPHRDMLRNIVDILLFTNLAILNALNLYQHNHRLYSSKNIGSTSVFALQYILAVLPVAVLAACLCWRLCKSRLIRVMRRLIRKLLPRSRERLYDEDSTQIPSTSSEDEEVTSINNYLPGRPPVGVMKGPKVRPREYMSPSGSSAANIPVTVVGVVDKEMGDAVTHQTHMTEGYFLKKEWNSATATTPSSYGAI